MNKRWFAILSLIPLLCVSVSLFALDVADGKLKLVIHEESGRFSLYYQTDAAKQLYEPLFVDQDPRTSFISLLIDDRAFRLGETTTFKMRAEKADNGAILRFESANLLVTEHFSFIKTLGSEVSDGIRLDVSIENQSTRQLNVGLRLLLDTMLGEKDSSHFSTELRKIDSETVIDPRKDADIWWFSRNENLGLMGNISVKGASRPDMIHFANWKRLSDEPWKITASDGRNFNYLPYSVGDSAVSYYYDPRPLARGGRKSISLILAYANPAGLEGGIAPLESDLSDELRESVIRAESPDFSLYTDLQALNEMIDRLNKALEQGTVLSDQEYSDLETLLAKLSERNNIK